MNDPSGGHVFEPSPGLRRMGEVKLSRGGQSVERAVGFDQGQVRSENALGSLE